MVKESTNHTQPFFKIGYGAFVLLGIYHLLINQHPIDTATNLGIALVFDPFNHQISWNNRPKWQRVWLIMHVAIALTVLIFGILK